MSRHKHGRRMASIARPHASRNTLIRPASPLPWPLPLGARLESKPRPKARRTNKPHSHGSPDERDRERASTAPGDSMLCSRPSPSTSPSMPGPVFWTIPGIRYHGPSSTCTALICLQHHAGPQTAPGCRAHVRFQSQSRIRCVTHAPLSSAPPSSCLVVRVTVVIR